MLAYAGSYTLDDEKVVHHLDASWNQTWTGTDQVRFYKRDGNTLTISGAPAPDPYTGRQVIHRIVFQKARIGPATFKLRHYPVGNSLPAIRSCPTLT